MLTLPLHPVLAQVQNSLGVARVARSSWRFGDDDHLAPM